MRRRERRPRLRQRPVPKRQANLLERAWNATTRALWSWRLWAVPAIIAIAMNDWPVAASLSFATALTYALAPSERSPLLGLDHDMAVEAEGFLSSLIGLTGAPFYGGNRVEILNNGDEFYPVMLEAIRSAKRSITMEAYIYWEGEIGTTFAHALAERGNHGVQVKLLLDAVGSATIGQEILDVLEKGRCQIGWFNPLRWHALGRINRRTHRKSLIVDGQIGFTGGAGIADIWVGNAQDSDHWRDMEIRIEGPGVVPLQTGFAENWQSTTGELVNGPDFFPEPDTPGSVPVQTIMSSPVTGTSGARTLYYLAIVCARESIKIANPYFVPDLKAVDLLVEAKLRGVNVTIIVAGLHNDNWLARRNSVRLYGPLLAAGIEVYEYNRTMLHQKTMVIDSRWATIGTTNFDDRSFLFNDETNVSVVEPSIVKDVERAFKKDLAVSQRITLEAWRNRGVIERAEELVASFLEKQV